MMIRHRRFLLTALLTVLACTANAQEAIASMKAVPNHDLMVVTGSMKRGFSDRLVRVLDQHPAVKVILIESPGGLNTEAYSAARSLNERGIALRVLGRCASACAHLWAGVDRREIIGNGQIGLHSPRPGKAPPRLLKSIVRSWNERIYVEPLKKAGFSDAMIARARATPPESMIWLSSADLRKDGVQFTLVNAGSKSKK